VIDCRRLCETLDGGGGSAVNEAADTVRMCSDLHAEFFGRRKVALEPRADRQHFEDQLLAVKTANQISDLLELKRAASAAKEDAELQLDELQQKFLKRRKS